MSMTMKRDAKRLAKKGRHGDRNLLHITDTELLALMASGKVTRNPKTGLPEAFNLSDLNPFSGSSNFLAQLLDPFSDVYRDIGVGPGALKNMGEAIETGGWSNPFSSEATGWDVLAGGTMSEDPELRRLGRTIGTMFAGYGLGEAFGAAGAEAGAAGATEGGTAASAAEGTALYSTPASTGVNAYGGAYSTPAMTTTAGAGGTALGGSTVPAASLGLGGTASSAGVSSFDETGFEQGFQGEASSFDEAGFNFDPMSVDASVSPSFNASGFENNLSAELSAGAPAEPSYYQQFLDFMKSRGWKKNLMSGMQLYNTAEGFAQAKEMEKLARQADPMAAQRPGYAAELAALQKDPSLLTSRPGYKAGEQAVMRTLAAQGYLGSGNARLRTADYGSQAYDREIARLSQLASPSLAASQAQAMAAGQKSKALASLGYTAAGLFI